MIAQKLDKFDIIITQQQAKKTMNLKLILVILKKI